jgi:hypothetical protein
MNKTPHIVGGGLGTFRKDGAAAYAAKKKAEQKRENAARLARLARSVSK